MHWIGLVFSFLRNLLQFHHMEKCYPCSDIFVTEEILKLVTSPFDEQTSEISSTSADQFHLDTP